MRYLLLSSRRIAVAGLAALALAGCSLDVTDPTTVRASTIDPLADARVFSLSAQQNYYVAYGSLINNTAIYSNETWTGAVRNETNDIGRHVIVDTNVDLSGAFWAPMQQVIGTNDQVIEVLKGTPTFNTDIAVARSSLWSGMAVLHLAEIFCDGVLHVGPPLTTAQMLDSAIVRLQQAITVAGTFTNNAEATRILNTARVGLARAYLHKGDNQAAITAATQVPVTFVSSTVHVDDAQARARLSNPVFIASSATTQIVAGLYRALGDPRVTFVDAGINAQDNTNRLFRQTKYAGFTAPIRIASGLEARYIIAEAQLELGNTAPALTLIAERRSAGSQPAFTGTTQAEVLAELMDQRARDFWLEAKHLGDILRNPAAAALVPPAGSPFYKPTFGNFLPIACLPIPFAEKANNPNIP